MDTDVKEKLTLSLDSLESAFSDSTRKVLRQIKTEWQKVMTYRNELLSKEDELFSIKEKVTHLNELKRQNEKYLITSQSRLNNLKQSNTQLKGKLNHLKKEEERLAKKCNEEEEYLKKKLSFYEEKWRQRYEVYCAKNPKMIERENSIRELEGLKEKLSALDQELQKHEKNLFRAKCERNGRTSDEMKMCPFSVFVIKIAQLYVDTRKVMGECNELSREIVAAERNIQIQKLKQQLDHSNLENSGMKSKENASNSFYENMGLSRDSLRFTPMQSHTMITESNIFEQNFENPSNYSEDRDQQMEICNDDHPLQTIKTMNIENTEESDPNTSNFEPDAVTNDGFGRHRDANVDLNKSVHQSPISRNMEGIPTPVETRQGISVSNNNTPKTAPKDKKVRSWLDKLKIFVPTFAKTTEKVRTYDVEDMKKQAETRKVKEIKPAGGQSLDNTKTADYETKEYTPSGAPRKQTSSPDFKTFGDESGKQKVTTQSMLPTKGENLERYPLNLDIRSIPIQNEQRTSVFKYTSKYFSTDMHMDWDATEENEITKPLGEVNKEEVVESAKQVKVQDNTAQKEAGDNLNETREPRDKEDRNEEPKGHDYSSKTKNLPIEIARANSREGHSILIKSRATGESMKSPPKSVSFVNEIQPNSLKDIDNDYQIKFGNLKVDKKQIPPIRRVEQTTSKETPHVENLKSTAQDLTRDATTSEDLKLNPLQVQKDDSNNDRSSENDMDVDKLDRASVSSATDITVNSPYPSFATPQSVDQTQRSSDSNPKTPMATTAQNPTTDQQDDIGMSSSICHFKPESMSPGFAYTTRLMYENGAVAPDKKEPSNKEVARELQNSMFAQLSYFGRSPNDLNFTQGVSGTPEEDKNEFLLASAFEDYLTDSPPTVKGTEKSMFTFAEVSPEREGRNDFFPLFAADNEESSKDSKNNEGGQFMFNFGATGNDKSPEETSGFKFTF